MRPTRRTLVLGAAAGLAGCGFRPVYGPLSGGGTIRPELASIYVAVFSERPGQLLRQALQQRLAGTDEGVAKQYELVGGFGIAPEALGIQSDTSATRVRLTGTATWALRQLGLKQTVLTNGSARVIDGYNINNQQYFAAELESASAFERMANTAADQIALDLATFLRARAEAA